MRGACQSVGKSCARHSDPFKETFPENAFSAVFRAWALNAGGRRVRLPPYGTPARVGSTVPTARLPTPPTALGQHPSLVADSGKAPPMAPMAPMAPMVSMRSLLPLHSTCACVCVSLHLLSCFLPVGTVGRAPRPDMSPAIHSGVIPDTGTAGATP